MNIAVILAAGKGTRLGEKTPKQFLVVDNKPLFLYSTLTFQDHPLIDQIIVVSEECYFKTIKDICQANNISKLKGVVSGGKTRQESVYNALTYLSRYAKDNDVILIHDSARPLISKEIINAHLEKSKQYSAINTAIKVTDTIIMAENNITSKTLNRDSLYQVQTPQTFKFDTIYRAHKEALANNVISASDDIQLVEPLNILVALVNGDKHNFKVTTIEDLRLLESLI